MIASPNAIRVERFSITGLFGLYDHDVPLKQTERVTILHGPNGVGKSALLRLLAAFSSGRYQEFALTPFKEFSVFLSGGMTVTIFGSEEKSPTQHKTISVRLAPALGDSSTFELPIALSFDRIAHQLERESPYVARLAEDQYFDHRNGKTLTAEQIVEKYGTAADVAATLTVQMDAEPQDLKRLRGEISIHLVETQRLLRLPSDPFSRVDRHERKPMIATVRSYSEEIMRQIGTSLSRYGTESQKLDQTFPQRLINSKSVSAPEVEDMKRRLGDLDLLQNGLNDLGLIDKVSYPALPSQIDALDDVKRSVMALYVEDSERKLNVFNDLATRIRLLLESVNGKFRNKKLIVSRERGLQVIDQRGRFVGLESLSSGEQHELVLWFDLLFRVGINTLVLIDEPELSLHVSWQKKFLPELLAIARTIPFDSIVATHSPFIIGDRLDLTVPLDADVDE